MDDEKQNNLIAYILENLENLSTQNILRLNAWINNELTIRYK